MHPPDFSRFDGSGRSPRPAQRQIIEWLKSVWHESPVKALIGPPGIGKSFIARAVQIATGGVIITPSNILVDQYSTTYPHVNIVKGKAHYACKDAGMTCHEWTNVLEQKTCIDCPYTACKAAARAGDPTIFNPMSLAYFVKQQPSKFPAVVVDEAHQLPGMLTNLVTRRLRRSAYFFHDNITNELELHRWLSNQSARCYKLTDDYRNVGNMREAVKAREDAESFSLLAETVHREPHNVAVWLDEERLPGGRKETYLNIRPISPPKFLVDAVCNTDNLILMSGTLFPHDVLALSGGDRVAWLDVPSPIPIKNRPILRRPTPFKMNANTDPVDIAVAIRQVIAEFPNRNTIIHVSYSLSKKLAPHVSPKVIVNTAETKDACLERFKKEGGIWLASGCAEGLDLKDDLCRLNIIPKLLFPDLTDPAVKKRRGLPDGETWYDLETIKTTIQQVGRSTRHEKDHSITVVMDPNFSRLVARQKASIPQSFYEAIEWRGR